MKFYATVAIVLLMAVFASFSDDKNHPSISPLNGKAAHNISGDYGMWVHPILAVKRMHEGVDFKIDTGTAVLATAEGKVIWVGSHKDGFGLSLKLQHKADITTFYCHLSRCVVKKGEKVRQGQLIAYSGNTGLSTAPHLHYGVFKNAKSVDPKEFLPK